ncbi:MAG: SRPBCC family protein [Actinomycetota bacterium]|jgi:uncharacterized protein YndB with AHSA1/START domain|nr:SRPBCC family protein [Actinomycetota bacterium]
MSERDVTHSTFTLERVYPANRSRVFAAWADPAAKAQWFAGPNGDYELDFRVGGRELARGRPEGGPVLTFESRYHDIVVDERIVFSSTMTAAGQDVCTVSVTTVELHPEGESTRLVLTQQGAYLDGHEDPAWREQGTGAQLDALAEQLGNTSSDA